MFAFAQDTEYHRADPRPCETPAMKVVCSYCQQSMDDKPPLDDPVTSHGICAACYDHFGPQWDGLSTGEFLDRFDTPVVVVDAKARVVAINQAMAAHRGVESRTAAGMLGGELLECTNARRPGGCGHTIHCKACAIRRVVTETLHSGEPQHEVRATLDRPEDSADLVLSSFPRDGLIYLLVESAQPPGQG